MLVEYCGSQKTIIGYPKSSTDSFSSKSHTYFDTKKITYDHKHENKIIPYLIVYIEFLFYCTGTWNTKNAIQFTYTWATLYFL